MFEIPPPSTQQIENMACMNPHFEKSAVLFFVGAIFFTWYVARENSFGIKDAILAAIGFKKHPRNWRVNLFHAAILILPMALFLFFSRGCYLP